MAQTTITQALLSLAKVYNVDERAIMPDDTSAEIIQLIAGGIVFGSSNVTPSAPEGTTDYWGTKASQIQTGVTIADGAVTGTLHKLTSGQLVTDWGEGYFLALKFTKNNAKASSIKVGLRPSKGSGLVELDADMDGVFKITDKDAQDFEILCSDGNVSYSIILDLSGLTLEA
jgi:hypothetical protein